MLDFLIVIWYIFILQRHILLYCVQVIKYFRLMMDLQAQA